MRSQSHDRQQPMQQHRRSDGSHPRRSPSEPREFKHGHTSSNRVDGSKRYMHSQQPGAHEFRKDHQQQQFTNTQNGGENLKRRRMSEVQEPIH